MQSPSSQLPTEEKPIVIKQGKRLRPVTSKEIFQLTQWEMDFRFVREVEYLEREGRVPSRAELEEAIGLNRSELLAVRQGKRQIGLLQVRMLHEKFRGDRDYIMYGQRNKELSAPYIPGVGRIDRYEPYIHEYKSPARWRVGRRPETHPAYFPSDPENEQWSSPERLPSNVRGKKAAAEQE
jgi:hypothetical protein